MDGILLIDKERGPTSHDIVDRVRGESGERRVGHAGTLDPNATGLLVLCLGRALKLVEFMEGHDKEYDVAIRLGRVTETDDAEGCTVTETDPSAVSREALLAAAARFIGEIPQRPPAYSAVKVGGRPLYRYARAGESVVAPERVVRVHELALLSFDPPIARFRVRCSKGTYVRSLARDLGAALGCGASVEELRRTAGGPFRVEQAVRGFDPKALLPMDAGLADLPKVSLPPDYAGRFAKGQGVDVTPPAPLVRVYQEERFVGVGYDRDGRLWPRKVLG
ncbi:MAG: tRNA pseudouridine(55) synthase TruB [Planctomycetes bacterium]|nr:tRNA pseudouridine(55) synthase TruB [Planctomycetota bacterium]